MKYEKVLKRRARNPDEIHEREYYFDEGFGVSIEEHVKAVKAHAPGITVEMRRDNDGYAIIKTSMKRQYKYNLDDILSSNANQTKANQKLKHSIEVLLRQALGTDAPDKGTLEKLIQASQDGDQLYDFDTQSKIKLEKAINGLQSGAISSEQFAQEYQNIYSNAEFDTSRPIKEVPISHIFNGALDEHIKDQALDHLRKDKKIIAKELGEQIMLKANKFLYFTERKESDFARMPIAESSLFERQVAELEETDFDKRIEAAEREELHGTEKAYFLDLKE